MYTHYVWTNTKRGNTQAQWVEKKYIMLRAGIGLPFLFSLPLIQDNECEFHLAKHKVMVIWKRKQKNNPTKSTTDHSSECSLARLCNQHENWLAMGREYICKLATNTLFIRLRCKLEGNLWGKQEGGGPMVTRLECKVHEVGLGGGGLKKVHLFRKVTFRYFGVSPKTEARGEITEKRSILPALHTSDAGQQPVEY